MARCWLRMVVLGVTLSLASGVPFANQDLAVLLEEPAETAKEPKDDRFYGGIHQEGVDRLKQTHKGTSKAAKITEPLKFKEPTKTVVVKLKKKEKSSNYRVLNAVINAASQLQQKAELPSHMKDRTLDKAVAKANKEIVAADKENEKNLATKAYHKKLSVIKTNQSRVQSYSMSATSSTEQDFAGEKKKNENDPDKGTEKKVATKMDSSPIPPVNTTRLQYEYDVKPITDTEDSPSYEQATKMEQEDAVMEQQVDNEAKQYDALKKTGTLNPLPKVAKKPSAKKSKLDQAKELFASVAQEDSEQKKHEKLDMQYEGTYGEARTNFSAVKHKSAITTPQAQALYDKYKAKEDAGADLKADVAAVQAAKAAGEAEHNENLYESYQNLPTQENVAKLVKEGDAGAVALQKDFNLQTKLDKENAKHPNRVPKTLEDEIKRRKLLEVARWQAQTLLKEGKEAITNQAYQLEESGSAADLAVLEANVKRVALGRPALSAGEANSTITMMASEKKLAKEVGPEIMSVYQKSMNATKQRIADRVSEMVSDATADSGLEPDFPYSGDADQLLPDSINDPMLDQNGIYGDAYDPNDYNPDTPDDNIETRAVDDETALDTDSGEEAQLQKETDAEDKLDQPIEELTRDTSAGSLDDFKVEADKRKLKGQTPPVQTYHEKLDSKFKIFPIMPDAMAPDPPDPNMQIISEEPSDTDVDIPAGKGQVEYSLD